ncbi:MAG: methyl-accepting chemotaxis protein [Bacteroidales bacterium]
MGNFFSSIRNKLILYMGIASSLYFLMIIGYYFYKRATSFDKAKSEIKMLAERSVLEVNNELSKYVGIVKGLKFNFLRSDLTSVAEKDRVFNPYFEIALAENKNFLGTWYSMELSKYDDGWGNEPGRRRVSYFRDANGAIDVKIDTLEIGGIKKLTGYHKVKAARKDAIMEPYWCDYTMEGVEQFLETTLASPVLENGEFVGLVGVDLELKSFKNIVNKIKVYEQGYAFLVSNTGIYVAHPEDSLVGKTFAEVNPDEDKQYGISEKILKGEGFDFLASYDYTGEQIYLLFVPLKVEETETPWAMGFLAKKSEILGDANKDLRNSIIFALMGFVIMLLFIFIFSARLTNPLKQGVNFAKAISEGDLQTELKIHNADETGILTNSLNTMSGRLKAIISQLKESIENLGNMSLALKESSADISDKAGRQATTSESIIISVEQVAENIRNNLNNSKQTEVIASKTVETVRESNQTSQQNIGAMQEIAGKIGVISEIAFQTNILALNAAVESARAGQQGKGFAVVATEVRKLAERSRVAADEITRLTLNSVSTSEVAGDQLKKVVPEIENILKLVKEISMASSEQDAGISSINRSLNQLDQIARNNAETAQHLAQNALELNQLSVELAEMIKFFRI